MISSLIKPLLIAICVINLPRKSAACFIRSYNLRGVKSEIICSDNFLTAALLSYAS